MSDPLLLRKGLYGIDAPDEIAPAISATAGMTACAVFDATRVYRYHLMRRWTEGTGICTFIMLNPSTADEKVLDPTVTRCLKFAKRWGYRQLDVLNIFAVRSTDPQLLYTHPAPIGPHNMTVIKTMAALADRVVCAWGVHGAFMEQGAQVRALLQELPETPVYHLGLTKHGHPRHPLYTKHDLQPIRWSL